MQGRAVLELRLGDHLRLRKPHPCGRRTWRVVRLGADIGLVCDGCGRRVLLERRRVEQRLVEFLERGPEGSPPQAPAPPADAGLPAGSLSSAQDASAPDATAQDAIAQDAGAGQS